MSKETTAVMDADTQSYRLPRSAVPQRYEIRLEPDLSQFTFVGQEVVQIIIAEPITEILLNSVDLEINQAAISNDRGDDFTAKITYDTENERVRLTFDHTLQPGKWQLQLYFRGTLNDKLHGFYRSTYTDAKGQKQVVATTQFEATDARRAFPCWDEPDLKAVFKVSLVVDQGLQAISNARIETEKKLSNSQKKEVVFHETMKMSTYLVAFVVGNLASTEPIDVQGTPVRIWAPPDKLHLAKFAEGIASHSLSYFNEFYGIKYPGDKLDLIAIPDFAFGAMENLGAVIFRETALLVDEKTATHSELERVGDVVAHEIAHMWFGDLATMRWWNGIWLNEAFATFMEMLAVDTWKPEWKRWETFGVSRAAALFIDGLQSTRPIEFPVRRPEEAQGMFDILTYEKGASVLRMLQQYLQPEVFRRGIALYLSKHKYANTETTDLWDAIEESSKQPVREIMDSWIYQEGYPLISAELDAKGTTLTLTQQRFIYDSTGKAKGKTSGEVLFHVPIMLKAKTNKGIVTKRVLLQERSTQVKFDHPVQYVVVNEAGYGFYRVRYAQPLLKALTNNLRDALSAIERFNLVNDTWAAVVAGLQPLSTYLEMAHLFADETDKNVWAVLIGSMQYLDRLSPNNEGFQNFVRTVCGPAFTKLGWKPKDGEDALTQELRGMLISVLGTMGGDTEIQKHAQALYEKYKADKSSVNPDIVPALVTILAYSGNKDRYDQFVKEFKNAPNAQVEDRYMYSLASFRDIDLLSETLKKTLNGEVRLQSAPFLVRSVMVNTVGRYVAWEFIEKNWDNIAKIFPELFFSRMFEGIVALDSEDYLKKTREFFATHPIKQGNKQIEQSLEKQAIAIALKIREAKTLATF